MASTSVVVYTRPVRKAVFLQQASLGGLAIKCLQSVLHAERTEATRWQCIELSFKEMNDR